MRMMNHLTQNIYTTDTGITVQWQFSLPFHDRTVIVTVDDAVKDPVLDKQNTFIVDSYQRSRDAAVLIVDALELSA